MSISKSALTFKTTRSLWVAASVAALLSACASSPKADTVEPHTFSSMKVEKPSDLQNLFGFISPYRISVQQGNFVSKEMVSQLKQGMTREQVRTVLGTPTLTDMFHEDRWDYPFRLQKSNGEIISSRLAIHFKDNAVEKFDGGNLPNEKEYLALISTGQIQSKIESVPDEMASSKKTK